MSTYLYRALPAPNKGLKVKGIKSPEARFSNTIEELLNEMGVDGWEYQRAELLPSVERSGLTGTTTEWRNVLIFRKLHDGDTQINLPVPNVAADANDAVVASEHQGDDQTKIEESATHQAPHNDPEKTVETR